MSWDNESEIRRKRKKYIVLTIQQHDGQATGNYGMSINLYAKKKKAYQAILNYCEKQGNDTLGKYGIDKLRKRFPLGTEIILEHSPKLCCIVTKISKNKSIGKSISIETDDIQGSF